jgi:hypothetical protein
MKLHAKRESGYILVGTLFVIGLVLLITANMLHLSTAHAKTRAVVNKQSEYYYQVEDTLNRVVGWMQQNSQGLGAAFVGSTFSSNFTIGAPSLGDNEGEHFSVPTMVKIAGTNSSAMLSNNAFFGTAAFPAVTALGGGGAFDAVSSFQNADLGEANARIILIWARSTDGNFEPIFRIDVITGNDPDRGVHSFSYVYSTLVSSLGSATGFHGEEFVTFGSPNNDCYSFVYSHNAATNTWSKGAPRSNCPVSSNGDIDIKSKIYGTAETNKSNGLDLLPPGGNVSGEMCESPGCHTNALPPLSDFDTYCPSHGGDVSVNSNTTLPAGCYRDITVGANRTLTLNDSSGAYYFRNISLTGNNANVAIAPATATAQITMYANMLNSNNQINGNRVFNGNNSPHQAQINYYGTEPLTLNGTADMQAFINAPNAHVQVNGNFNYYGAISAKSLDIGGSARINYQEIDLAATAVVSDVNFSLRKASQRYR